MNIIRMLFIIVLFASSKSFSQTEVSTDVTDVIKLTFLNPGVAYEKRIGKSKTLYSHIHMSPSLGFSFSSSQGNSSYFWLDPAISVQYRLYYNLKKRINGGKRTAMNSINYLAPALDVVFTKASFSQTYLPEETRRPLTEVGFVWGMQRNYPKNFSLDLNVGPGFYFTRIKMLASDDAQIKETINGFTVLAHLTLAFWLNKRLRTTNLNK